MKAPSTDLLVKLAVGAAAIGAAWWVAQRMKTAASDAAGQVLDAAAAAVDSINPVNPDNIFASFGNSVVSAVAGRPETLGGGLRSLTSNDNERINAMLRGEPIPPPRSLFNPSTWWN